MQAYTYVTINQTVHFRCVFFTVYGLYLNKNINKKREKLAVGGLLLGEESLEDNIFSSLRRW